MAADAWTARCAGESGGLESNVCVHDSTVSLEVGHVGLKQFDGVHDSVLLRSILSSHVGKAFYGVGGA